MGDPDAPWTSDCTCYTPHPHPTDIDPPEPVIDKWCPVHGSGDPDYERDEAIERKRIGHD